MMVVQKLLFARVLPLSLRKGRKQKNGNKLKRQRLQLRNAQSMLRHLLFSPAVAGFLRGSEKWKSHIPHGAHAPTIVTFCPKSTLILRHRVRALTKLKLTRLLHEEPFFIN